MNTVTRYLPLVYLGLAAVTGYFVWRSLKFGSEKAGEALDSARSSTTNLLEHFFPLVNSNSLITHAVEFPNGERHAILGESVDSNGFFTYKGTRYRLLVDSAGRKHAVLVMF